MYKLLFGDKTHRLCALDNFIKKFVFTILEYSEENHELIENILDNEHEHEHETFIGYLKYILNKDNKLNYTKLKDHDKEYIFTGVHILLSIHTLVIHTLSIH